MFITCIGVRLLPMQSDMTIVFVSWILYGKRAKIWYRKSTNWFAFIVITVILPIAQVLYSKVNCVKIFFIIVSIFLVIKRGYVVWAISF